MFFRWWGFYALLGILVDFASGNKWGTFEFGSTLFWAFACASIAATLRIIPWYKLKVY